MPPLYAKPRLPRDTHSAPCLPDTVPHASVVRTVESQDKASCPHRRSHKGHFVDTSPWGVGQTKPMNSTHAYHGNRTVVAALQATTSVRDEPSRNHCSCSVIGSPTRKQSGFGSSSYYLRALQTHMRRIRPATTPECSSGSTPTPATRVQSSVRPTGKPVNTHAPRTKDRAAASIERAVWTTKDNNNTKAVAVIHTARNDAFDAATATLVQTRASPQERVSACSSSRSSISKTLSPVRVDVSTQTTVVVCHDKDVMACPGRESDGHVERGMRGGEAGEGGKSYVGVPGGHTDRESSHIFDSSQVDEGANNTGNNSSINLRHRGFMDSLYMNNDASVNDTMRSTHCTTESMHSSIISDPYSITRVVSSLSDTPFSVLCSGRRAPMADDRRSRIGSSYTAALAECAKTILSDARRRRGQLANEQKRALQRRRYLLQRYSGHVRALRTTTSQEDVPYSTYDKTIQDQGSRMYMRNKENAWRAYNTKQQQQQKQQPEQHRGPYTAHTNANFQDCRPDRALTSLLFGATNRCVMMCDKQGTVEPPPCTRVITDSHTSDTDIQPTATHTSPSEATLSALQSCVPFTTSLMPNAQSTQSGSHAPPCILTSLSHTCLVDDACDSVLCDAAAQLHVLRQSRTPARPLRCRTPPSLSREQRIPSMTETDAAEVSSLAVPRSVRRGDALAQQAGVKDEAEWLMCTDMDRWLRRSCATQPRPCRHT